VTIQVAARLGADARGVVMMCIAMAAFAANDALMKAALQTVPLMQAIGVRGGLTFSALALVALAGGRLVLRMPARDRAMLALRTLAEVGGTVTFLAALAHMPLANLTAILQSLPLAVSLAAVLVLGERVAWRQGVAIMAGFAGVLLIVRPGGEGFSVWSLLGVLSVGMVVLRDLSTRRMSAALPTLTVATAAAGAVGLTGAVGVLATGHWAAMEGGDVAMLAGAAGFLVLGYLTVVQAMRQGDVARVAPFRYSALVWAILLGWLVFGTLPDALAWTGAALVVASGLVALKSGRN
jgi:drug/metabolite transporter (DMT)-like permease